MTVENNNSDGTNNNDFDKYLESLDVCEKNCQNRIGSIEVISKSAALETIYFPIPQDFRKTVSRIESFFSGNSKHDNSAKTENLLSKKIEGTWL